MFRGTEVATPSFWKETHCDKTDYCDNNHGRSHQPWLATSEGGEPHRDDWRWSCKDRAWDFSAERESGKAVLCIEEFCEVSSLGAEHAKAADAESQGEGEVDEQCVSGVYEHKEREGRDRANRGDEEVCGFAADPVS